MHGDTIDGLRAQAMEARRGFLVAVSLLGATALLAPAGVHAAPSSVGSACAPGLAAAVDDARTKIDTWARQGPEANQAPVEGVPGEPEPAFICPLDQSGRRFLVAINWAPRMEQGLYIVDVGARGATEAEVQVFHVPGYPSLEAVLPDRSGVPHLLYCLKDLHQGISSEYCALVNLRSLHMETPPPPFRPYLSLDEVEVLNVGTAGACSELAPDTVGKVHVTDPGKDGYREVRAEVSELDCTTGQPRRTFTRTFRPTATGFVETR